MAVHQRRLLGLMTVVFYFEHEWSSVCLCMVSKYSCERVVVNTHKIG